MLPEGFKWREDPDGDQGLFLGDVRVALLTPLANSRYRVVINPTLITIRYVFLSSEAAARRYVEAWAVKWEARILREYAGYAADRRS